MPDHVTREELTAHIEPMKDDIREIKSDVKTLVSAKYDDSWFGGRGQAVIVGVIPALVAIIVTTLIALLH